MFDEDYYKQCLDELLKIIPKKELNKIFEEDCELCRDFLGFVNVYKPLSQMISKEFVVIDFGCDLAPQSYFFQNHKAYIGVDINSKERCTPPNAIHFSCSIQKFIHDFKELFGNHAGIASCFAICSFVPDKKAKELIRETFQNIAVYYPTNDMESLMLDGIKIMKKQQDRRKKMKIALDKGAFLPEYAHLTDAGMDIRTSIDCTVPAHGSIVINTGLHVDIPDGFVGMIKSKSGLNVKHDIISEGVIDTEFSGSILVKLYNLGDNDYTFNKGDKITQMVVMPYLHVDIERVDEIVPRGRGNNGYGSTGR